MSDTDRIASWLVPAVVGAAATLIGTVTTFYLTSTKDRQEHHRAVAAVRLQIVESPATATDIKKARLLLQYGLKPIDDAKMYAQFEHGVLDLFASQAAEIVSPSDNSTLQQIAPPVSGDLLELIGKFSTAERLAASNSLILRAQTQKQAVADALIAHIQPPGLRHSYRINLYIAFTLARLVGGWSGTEAQHARVASLRRTEDYDDPTFKKHVDTALRNWRSQ